MTDADRQYNGRLIEDLCRIGTEIAEGFMPAGCSCLATTRSGKWHSRYCPKHEIYLAKLAKRQNKSRLSNAPACNPIGEHVRAAGLEYQSGASEFQPGDPCTYELPDWSDRNAYQCGKTSTTIDEEGEPRCEEHQ